MTEVGCRRQRRSAALVRVPLIADAEQDRAEHLAAVEHLAMAGKSPTRARIRLRISDYRLALLRLNEKGLTP